MFNQDNYTLPHSEEFEKAVISSLLMEVDSFEIASNIINESMFYSEKCAILYKIIAKMQRDDIPVDLLSVNEQLKIDNITKVATYDLAELSNYVSQAAHLEHHCEVLLEKYVQREIIKNCSKLQREAMQEGVNVKQLLEKCEQSFFNLSQGNVKKDLVKIDTLIDEVILKTRKAAENQGEIIGVPSGFTDLDRITNGWQPTDLVIIAARPAMGKTAFALSMARNMAVNFNKKVAFFSLEMGNVQLTQRLIVSETEIYSEKIKKGNLSNFEFEQLEHRCNNLRDVGVYVDDTPSLSILELRTKARRLQKEEGVDVIMIDYLQLMTATGIKNRQEEVATISRNLKALAKELNIPIIALAQLNRGVESRGTTIESKRPQLSDLRESGSIEQDADIVCFIHRPEYYGHTEDEDGNNMAGIGQVIIAKHRNGATADVNLRFKAELIKFQNITEIAGDRIGSMGEFEY